MDELVSVATIRQKPIELDAVAVAKLRRALITPHWRRMLPAWLVEAIDHRAVDLHWEQTRVHGALAFRDDWIVRQADGALTVYPPEAFAAAFEVLR